MEDETFWTDEEVKHFLVMAYMSGWRDRDMDLVGRYGQKNFGRVAEAKSDLAVDGKTTDPYI